MDPCRPPVGHVHQGPTFPFHFPHRMHSHGADTSFLSLQPMSSRPLTSTMLSTRANSPHRLESAFHCARAPVSLKLELPRRLLDCFAARHGSAIQLSQVATSFDFSAPWRNPRVHGSMVMHRVLCCLTESEEPFDISEWLGHVLRTMDAAGWQRDAFVQWLLTADAVTLSPLD
jgi:hypothetical protein